MSLGTLSSRVLGLVRDALLGSLFGRTVTDAFVVAFRLPNFFRRLLGEGSLNVSFVPVFVEQLQGEGDEELRKKRAMRLTHSIFTLLTLVSSTLSVLGILFMEPLMELLVGTEEFAGIPGKLELTILFARIMFVYLYLVTSYAFLMSVANSLRAFFIPALAPAFFNLCVIIAAILPESSSEYSGLNLAFGVVVGGAVQFFMVAYQLFKLGALPRLTLQIRVPGLSLVLKNMIPGLLGLGILQVISLLNIYFAGLLPEGSHTYLYYGDRLLELPQSLLAISLGTALLPTLSELLAVGQKPQMLLTAAKYMRFLLFLALPSALGLFVLARPIVEVLFGRGEFDAQDIAATASVIQVYSLLLVASSFTKVIVPSFYALKDTKTPALVSLIVVVVHVLLAPVLISEMGLLGLVWSTTVSGFSNTLFLMLIYKKKVGDLYFFPLAKSIFKALPALAALGFAAYGTYGLLIQSREMFSMMILREFHQALCLAITIGLSAILYFVVAKLCKVEEAELFLQAFMRKWRKRRA